MKKTAMMMLLLAVTLMFVACSDDDNPNKGVCSIDKTDITLHVGETDKISFNGGDGNLGFAWSSDDPEIASVDVLTGVVTARKAGTTHVRPNTNGLQCRVNVLLPPISSIIVGTWKLSEVSGDGISYGAWLYEETTATFNGDGTYSGKGYFGNGGGTWVQSGEYTVITYVNGAEYCRYELKDFSGNTCTLVMSAGSASLWIKCVKK